MSQISWAHESEEFYDRWGTKHRLSSAYFPQSNGRAEVAVKSTKRLLECNIGPDGSLDTDRVVCALLQIRNTPDRDCKLSPAQILFGRPLRDSMPCIDKSSAIFDNTDIHAHWHRVWKAKEDAIMSRTAKSCEKLSEHSRPLHPLANKDSVFIQNQTVNSSNFGKWDTHGVVIAKRNYDQYLVRKSGSGKLTLRNRRFLRKFDREIPLNHVSPMPTVPVRNTPTEHVNARDIRPENESRSITRTPPPTSNKEPSPTSNADPPSDSTTPTAPVAKPAPYMPVQETRDVIPTVPVQVLRRSGRASQPRQVYDASSGSYTDVNIWQGQQGQR